MRKCIMVVLSLCILLGGLVLGAQSVFGLEAEQKVSPPENFLRYQTEKKSPWLAVGAAWLCPTLGHAYAGNWGRGAKFLVADVACYGIVIIGASMIEEETDEWGYTYTTISSTGATLSLIGYVGLLVSRIWEYIDAYKTAEDYNKKLAEKCGIKLSLRQGKPYLQLSYKF